ncbi:MAG: hypothetical protein A2224_00540 [Candidatus Magasanikbacteria bacterium RIFOXYA2_FULL_40_20]|nr:MAG: hypothetical protein A2224_00540 [Candidatus Magasanikbacteria bacterium RIFOXYA2_FULL_40_20]
MDNTKTKPRDDSVFTLLGIQKLFQKGDGVNNKKPCHIYVKYHFLVNFKSPRVLDAWALAFLRRLSFLILFASLFYDRALIIF